MLKYIFIQIPDRILKKIFMEKLMTFYILKIFNTVTLKQKM